MEKILCKRCGQPKPKSSSWQSKTFGGRICNDCYKAVGERINAFRSGRPLVTKTVAPKESPKAQGMIRRAFNRLFNRRGVQ